MTHKRKLTSKTLLLLGIVSIIIAVALYLFFTHLNKPKTSPIPISTIHQLPTQGGRPAKSPTTSSNTNQGTVTDNNGQVNNGTNTQPNQWTQSQSGNVTVKQPSSDSTIQDGEILSGSALVNQVQYRLIDNQVGVISQGILNVVNGNFSGSINFKSYSTTGRLDVFSTDSNGKEINEVQIPVNF